MMADPTIPYPLTISATSAVGTVVLENTSIPPSATNRRNNKISADLDSNKNITFDLANLVSGYSNGDLIEIRVNGIRSERATHTVKTSKLNPKVTLTGTTSDYSGANIT